MRLRRSLLPRVSPFVTGGDRGGGDGEWGTCLTMGAPTADWASEGTAAARLPPLRAD